MMSTHEVYDMINKALQAMGIGVAGTFSVLAIFYIVLKVMMSKTSNTKQEE